MIVETETPMATHASTVPLRSAAAAPARHTTPGTSVDTSFLTAAHPAATAVLRGVAETYRRAASLAQRSPATSWLTREHVGFFAVAIAGLFLLMPRVLMLGRYVAERVLLDLPVAKPDLVHWPYVPIIVVPLILGALATFLARTNVRLAALAVLAVAGGFAFGYLEPASVPVFVAFAAIAFGVIRLPVPRFYVALTLVGLSLALLFVCLRWFPGTGIAAFAAFQTPLVPMLWYSAYEHKPKRPLRAVRFAPYLFTRFFAGPVVTYGDMFSPAKGARLAEVRFGGVKALYVAATASLAVGALDLFLEPRRVGELSGLTLLLVSYLGYVSAYCKTVVGFNIATGILRLFGLPIRDNFHYWLLARTPNEHWQRWNLLFREWVITFVFFPIMRSKRWLFAAIMAALLTSGALHLVPSMLFRQGDAFHAVTGTAYWIINGLAIYAVIKIPQLFPRAVATLRIDGGLAWSVVGVVATSAFYGILHSVKENAASWADVTGYFARLTQVF